MNAKKEWILYNISHTLNTPFQSSKINPIEHLCIVRKTVSEIKNIRIFIEIRIFKKSKIN